MDTPGNSERGQPLAVPLSDGLGLAERLRACLRFDEPNQSESQLEQLARSAAVEIERQRRMLDAVRGMARSALQTNSKDRHDWIADMAIICEEVERFLKA